MPISHSGRLVFDQVNLFIILRVVHAPPSQKLDDQHTSDMGIFCLLYGRWEMVKEPLFSFGVKFGRIPKYTRKDR